MTFRLLIKIITALLIAAALTSSALATDGDLAITRVYSGWRDAASFKRISEYFSGRENTGGEAILRTHPDQRAGYYFLVRVANSGAPRKVTAHLEIITDAMAKPIEFSFSPELGAGNTVFHLGLTGPDWPNAATNPVAWKIDLIDADGKPLAVEKSYLWERPAAK